MNKHDILSYLGNLFVRYQALEEFFKSFTKLTKDTKQSIANCIVILVLVCLVFGFVSGGFFATRKWYDDKLGYENRLLRLTEVAEELADDRDNWKKAYTHGYFEVRQDIAEYLNAELHARVLWMLNVFEQNKHIIEQHSEIELAVDLVDEYFLECKSVDELVKNVRERAELFDATIGSMKFPEDKSRETIKRYGKSAVNDPNEQH